MHNTIGHQGVSTLDVLWVFYLSQPKQIKKAFRDRLETQDETERQKKAQLAQWQTDLKNIRMLKSGWDNENAPCVAERLAKNPSLCFPAIASKALKGVGCLPMTDLGQILSRKFGS